MSTTNAQKRKQAKRKAREQKTRGKGYRKSKAFATLSAGSIGGRAAADDIAQRWLELGERWYEKATVEDRKEARDLLLLDQRKATMPNFYYTLAAEGICEPEVFLRFGELPAAGRSGKYKNGTTIRGYEEGVSCYPACRTRGGHVLLDLSIRLPISLLFLWASPTGPPTSSGATFWGRGATGSRFSGARTTGRSSSPGTSWRRRRLAGRSRRGMRIGYRRIWPKMPRGWPTAGAEGPGRLDGALYPKHRLG